MCCMHMKSKKAIELYCFFFCKAHVYMFSLVCKAPRVFRKAPLLMLPGADQSQSLDAVARLLSVQYQKYL